MLVPAALRPHVAALHVYDVGLGTGPGVHIGMPSTTLTLVLSLGEPLDVSWADRPGTRTRTWASLSGVHSGPASIHHRGHQRGIQLALTPAAARALLGVPAQELAGELLELGDVDPGLADLSDQLSDTLADERVGLLHRVLSGALDRHEAPGPRPEVGRALALLTRGASVSAVADQVGYSRRRLSTLVREEVGVA